MGDADRKLALRLTNPDLNVRERALRDDYRGTEVLLHAELAKLLTDETRSAWWPQCFAWLEATGSSSDDQFIGLIVTLVPHPWEPAPADPLRKYAKTEEAYLAVLAELREDSRLTSRGMRIGLGLAGLGEPPVFTEESGVGLPAPRTGPEQWRAIASAIFALASPIGWVREAAVRHLARRGTAVTDTLRAVRRSRLRARRAAIAALADIGWDEVDQADRRAVQRLIRIKQCNERLEPVEVNGQWFAVRTTDQAAVLDAFELRDPVPATMRMGFAAWARVDAPNALIDNYAQELVFVTPVLDGWTLVLAGDHGLPAEDSHDLCVRLSHRFGAAHWYLESEDGGCADSSAWCVAENGEIVAQRLYDFSEEEPAQPTDDELAAWLDARDPNGESRDGFSRQHTWKERRFPALKVVDRLSVDPSSLGALYGAEGHGVLALPAKEPDARYRGGLPI